ncbi:Dip2/Utp12 family-domain-containing protein [Obelidium mucronatum]|nr:Dip2/Utp12 family-domain-containing protein [Obelidium mucronatum]
MPNASSPASGQYVQSCFSADGRYFAGLLHSDAVVVFATATGALVLRSAQPQATCVALGCVGGVDAVAVGALTGRVAVVPLAAAAAGKDAAAAFQLGAPVAAVSIAADGRVAAASAGGAVRVFPGDAAAAPGALAKAALLAFDGAGRLLVAGTKLADGARVFAGHAQRVVALAATPERLVSAAAADRFVAVWDRASTRNTAALTLDAPPVAVAVSPAAANVLAVDEDGRLSVWPSLASLEKTAADKSTNKKKKQASSAIPTRQPTTTVSVTIVEVDAKSKRVLNTEGTPAPILSATFSTADSIIIAYGSPLRPCFESISVLKRDHQSADATDDDDEEEDALFAGPIQIVRAAKGNSFVGLDELVAKQLMASTKQYSESANAKLITSTTPFAMNVAAISSTTSAEESIQDRLHTLNLSLADNPESTPSTTTKKSTKRHDLLKTPTANSLHNLLTQAVHSGDAQLLEQCLQVSDPVVITATVKRLPASQVVPLLNLLTVRLQMKPTRAKSLVEWVRAVVVCHAAFLMTNPSLVSHLSTLHSTLSTRTETFTKLLKLSGRLDLVTSQIALRASRAQIGEDGEDDNEDREGVVVYDEEADDDDEMEQDGEDDEDEDLDSDEYESEDPDFDEDADLDEDEDDDEEAEDEENEGEDYE